MGSQPINVASLNARMNNQDVERREEQERMNVERQELHDAMQLLREQEIEHRDAERLEGERRDAE
ncbi:hypothetical protein B9479_004567, partial [Cryptococcus floricola]